jgi:hypothetical protein
MINSNDPSPHNYADAIQSVRETGAADFTMPGGTILKLDKNKLLQNYEAILFCAGIEQMLGEAVGFAPGQEQFKPAGSALSRYAETPEEWMPPLGLLLGRARKAKGFKKRLMDEIEHFKLARDKVLHGETPSFGIRTRKRSRGIFQELAAHSRLTPRVKLVERLAQVDAAKKALPNATSDEMLSTLRLLYLSIEAESDIRRALMPHQVRNLQAVESVFELLRIEDAHKCCFKREGVVQKFRASALIRNHIVHGTIITPTTLQAQIITGAHSSVGLALAEISFRKSGGKACEGDFSNNLDF